MPLFGPYIYKNKKGEKYYIHFKDVGKVKLYFFSKEPVDAISSVPKGYEAFENENTGLPLLRKIDKTKKKA